MTVVIDFKEDEETMIRREAELARKQRHCEACTCYYC